MLRRGVVFLGCGDKMYENRLGTFNGALEFRMILYPDEERVIGNFHDLHEACLRISSAGRHSHLLEKLEVFIVEFVTMAMSFID